MVFKQQLSQVDWFLKFYLVSPQKFLKKIRYNNNEKMDDSEVIFMTKHDNDYKDRSRNEERKLNLLICLFICLPAACRLANLVWLER